MPSTPVTTLAAPIDALRAYEAALPAYEELASDDMATRAMAALDVIIRNWRGDSPTESLQRALGISRSTLHNWKSGKRAVPPAHVWRMAVAYCAPTFPADIVELDAAEADPAVRDKAAEVFNLFYSDNQRDALTSLLVHSPLRFRWTQHSTPRKVA